MHDRGSAVAEGDDVEVQRARTPERARTTVERGAGRENVINEDVMLPWD
jgi:hypothetical protein